MSRYFDEMQREVNQDFGIIESIEAKVIRDVSLVVGDREFPDPLRQEIMGCIAVYQYTTDPIPTTGYKNSNLSRRSSMIDELHSLFHCVASESIATRFGLLSDNPARILAQRDRYLERRRNHEE